MVMKDGFSGVITWTKHSNTSIKISSFVLHRRKSYKNDMKLNK